MAGIIASRMAKPKKLGPLAPLEPMGDPAPDKPTGLIDGARQPTPIVNLPQSGTDDPAHGTGMPASRGNGGGIVNIPGDPATPHVDAPLAPRGNGTPIVNLPPTEPPDPSGRSTTPIGPRGNGTPIINIPGDQTSDGRGPTPPIGPRGNGTPIVNAPSAPAPQNQGGPIDAAAALGDPSLNQNPGPVDAAAALGDPSLNQGVPKGIIDGARGNGTDIINLPGGDPTQPPAAKGRVSRTPYGPVQIAQEVDQPPEPTDNNNPLTTTAPPVSTVPGAPNPLENTVPPVGTVPGAPPPPATPPGTPNPLENTSPPVGSVPGAAPATPAPAPAGYSPAPPPASTPNVQTQPTNPGQPASPPGSTAWVPTQGIIDQIRGITPQQAIALGYTPAQIATVQRMIAEGYTPEGYTAGQVTENVSQAVDRITNADSVVMQRARARAAEAANARGLSNSSMAVQAGEAAVFDAALPMAQGDVNTGMFNVDQANQAQRFTTDARNQANAFLANARNMASQFNAGEANRSAMFAVEQANLAARFAADAENAASQFNATAYNQAAQRYADAMNAARAAQNDAENLARRDTANINAGLENTRIGAAAQVQAAGIHAGATIGAAQIGAAASASNTQAIITAQRESQIRGINADMERFHLQLGQQESQFVRGLSASQFNDYQRGLQNGMSLDLEPADRQNWLHNYNSVWAASGTLPFNIDLSHFPPAGSPPPPP